MDFNELEFSDRGQIGCVQATVFFENGYGASVVRGPGTYGNENGLYELAVLKGTAEESTLTYETSITSNVEGYLSEDAVFGLLVAIEALPNS